MTVEDAHATVIVLATLLMTDVALVDATDTILVTLLTTEVADVHEALTVCEGIR